VSIFKTVLPKKGLRNDNCNGHDCLKKEEKAYGGEAYVVG
jgi:hypothetical protein